MGINSSNFNYISPSGIAQNSFQPDADYQIGLAINQFNSLGETQNIPFSYSSTYAGLQLGIGGEVKLAKQVNSQTALFAYISNSWQLNSIQQDGISLYSFGQKTGINYQAVILDPNPISMPGNNFSGQALAQAAIQLKFSLLTGSQLDYQETQTTQTDAYGLINVIIGKGLKITPKSFDEISWNDTLKTLQ
eukprot:gene40151-53050_t